MKNTIGINLWNWMITLGPDAASLIPRIRAMGFDAVEIPLGTDDIDSTSLRDADLDAELEVSFCVSMGKGYDLSSFDSKSRQCAENHLRRCCCCAGEFGGGLICGPIYTGGGKVHLLNADDRAREWSHAVEGLRRIADYASDFGVRLAIEPINRYRTSVINTVEQALDMTEQIARSNVGILFDSYQANIEEADPAAALEAALLAKKLFHFHSCENHRGVPGTGHVPWNAYFSLLKKHHYNGHITIEAFMPGGLDAGWIPPKMDPDQRARAGLQFLKKCEEVYT